MKWLVVYPNVVQAILERRATLGLPTIPIKELDYGQDEVNQLVNLIDAKLLSGKAATLLGLLDIINQGWDGIWFITHAEEEGWYLNDGLVNTSETTAVVRAAGVQVLVLNTCSSYEVGREIAKELGTAVICTLKPVPDRQAFITGVLFAQKLAQGYNYREAYELAKPGQNSTYELIEARISVMPPNERNRYPQQGDAPDPNTLARLSKAVEELERIAYGHPGLGIAPLRELTNQLQKQIDQISTTLTQVQNTVKQIEKNQQDRNRLFTYMTIAFVATLITVAIIVYRGG